MPQQVYRLGVAFALVLVALVSARYFLRPGHLRRAGALQGCGPRLDRGTRQEICGSPGVRWLPRGDARYSGPLPPGGPSKPRKPLSVLAMPLSPFPGDRLMSRESTDEARVNELVHEESQEPLGRREFLRTCGCFAALILLGLTSPALERRDRGAALLQEPPWPDGL